MPLFRVPVFVAFPDLDFLTQQAVYHPAPTCSQCHWSISGVNAEEVGLDFFKKFPSIALM